MRHYLLQFFLLLVLPFMVCSADRKWPEMKEVDVSFAADLKAEKVEINLPLSDKSGRVQYLFWCRGGNDQYLYDQGEKLGVDFLVAFTCGLLSVGDNSVGSLLSEDGSPIWHTRAQFNDYELVGQCASYPEFGRVRTFRLRGFRLTLAVSDVQIDPTADARVKYFRLGVTLKSDRLATGAIAERPDYLSPYGPGRSCLTILKGRDPRYCRNPDKGWSWDLCKD